MIKEKIKETNEINFKLSEEKIHEFEIYEALDNDLIDDEEIDDTNLPIGNKNSHRNLRRKIYFSLAIFLSIMAVIGMVFSCSFIVNYIAKIIDNTDFKNELEQFIFPAVVVDCPAFLEAQDLPDEVILRIAAWDIMINSDKSKYQNSLGYITVPASDLEVHAQKIFGPDLVFSHQTLSDGNTTFEYRNNINSYTLPQSPNSLPYTPRVEEIEKLSEKLFKVKVGYYPPSQVWFAEENTESVAGKYMNYTLIENSTGGYTITAIEMSIDNQQQIF